MEFWRYYRILRRGRWLVAVTFLAAIVVAVAVNQPGVGDYSASANVSVPSTQQFFFVSGMSGTEQGLRASQSAELSIDLIRSRDVAERVVQTLHLNMRPEDLQRRLTVGLDPVVNLIRVTVTGKTAAEAVVLANAVADTAAAYDKELQRRQVTLAREFVEKQAQENQSNLRGAEDALLTFQQQNGVALSTSRNSEVANLGTALQQAQLSLQEIDARLASDRAQMNGQTAVRSYQQITFNPIAQQLQAQLVQLEVALTSELAVHTEKYPSVVTIRARIDAIKARLKNELSKIVASETFVHNPIYDALTQDRINLETERVALLAKSEALQRALNASTQALPTYAQKQMEQSRLARAVDILGRQYSTIQAQVADARLKEQEAQVLGTLSVVDYARTARPSPFRGLEFKLTVASVLGLLCGMGLVFFLEYLDNTIKTPENAERLLGLPALAAIPQHNPPFDEAYRMLRIALSSHESERGGFTIVVTSPKPGEGTSTVVRNLAQAFAAAGRRTIIVDAALRRPTQHTLFGLENGRGLAEILAGKASAEEALAKTDVPNLSVLPAGAASEDTIGLLCSKRVADLLSTLKQRGDVILIDTSSAGAFSDAFTFAPLTAGVLLVLDARRCSRGSEETVKNQFTRLGANVLGVVLTKVRPDLVDSYVHQDRFYGKKRGVVITAPAAATGVATVIVVIAGLLAGFSMGHVFTHHVAGLPVVIPQILSQWFSTISRL